MEQRRGQSKKRSSSKWSFIIAIAVCVVLAPILVMNLTIFVKSYTNPDKVPDFFGIKPFVVLSGSMSPEIYSGDLVITKTVDPSGLKVGDIISFKEGNVVVTHRITELSEKDGSPVFITQGDANDTEDGNAVSYAQVESVYLFKIKGIGNLAMFLQTPAGMLIFVGIPLCGFILYDIVRSRADDKRARARNRKAKAEIERLRAELARAQSGG